MTCEMRRGLLTTLLLCAGFAPTLPACGQIAAEMAAQMERQRHTQQFIFDDPLDKLWSEIAIATREGGCFLPPEPRVGETVLCARDDGTQGHDWMNVRLTAVEGGHRIEIIRMGEEKDEQGNWQPKPGQRANDIEFTLISRLHPDEATAIQAAADARRPEGEKTGKAVQKVVEENIKDGKFQAAD